MHIYHATIYFNKHTHEVVCDCVKLINMLVMITGVLLTQITKCENIGLMCRGLSERTECAWMFAIRLYAE